MKEKGIKILISIILFASTLMPFSVFADTYITTSNIVGCHISDQRPVDSNFYNQITCNLDANYEGYAQFTFSYRVGSQTTNTTAQRFVSVSGKQFVVEITTQSASMNTAFAVTVSSITNNHIILSDNQDEIVEYSTFPVESFNVQSYAYSNLQYEGFVDDSIYTFGIFNVPQNTEIYRSYGVENRLYWFIFVMDKNMYNQQSVANFLSFDNCSLTSYNFYTRFYYQGTLTYIFRMGLRVTSTGQFYITYTGSSDAVYMPIYCNEQSYMYNSTDFALTYGLSNQLLDDLHVIAQGSIGSQSDSGNLMNQNDTMASDMNSMATIENGYNQDFNTQLQNIDFTNPIQQNQGILPAASFVITIFNGLINNNPFSVLIIIVCILLIGKKVIGK